MFNDQTSEEDIVMMLNSLEEKGELVSFIERCYSELIFLGATPKTVGGLLLDAALLNTRVCLSYYLSIEDYSKVKALHDLLHKLNSPTTVEIDYSILESVVFCHN
jgi:hypothetical protein